MTTEELEFICDNDELMMYHHKLYRFVGMLGSDYIFSRVVDNNVIALNRNSVLTWGNIAFKKKASK